MKDGERKGDREGGGASVCVRKREKGGWGGGVTESEREFNLDQARIAVGRENVVGPHEQSQPRFLEYLRTP